MSHSTCMLEFVGGPFDGFRQRVSVPVHDLPLAVALPMNEIAGEIFGLDETLEAESEAIYELVRGKKGIQYRFHRQRPAQKSLQAM